MQQGGFVWYSLLEPVLICLGECEKFFIFFKIF